MTKLPPIPRRHARQQLVLKVEFDDAEGFRSNFLSDLSEGGLRINMAMEVGQRFMLNISFLGFMDPIQIEAEVQWSRAEGTPDGPSAGLAFVDMSPEAKTWVSELLDASTNVFITPESSSRVLLLEIQPFLREIYGQEVQNWAELRDEAPLELITLDDPDEWLRELGMAPATLAIIDVDDLPTDALELYHMVRNHPSAGDLPLIVIGTPANIEPFSHLQDDLLFALKKPLRFGVLMNTVRILARDPLASLR